MLELSLFLGPVPIFSPFFFGVRYKAPERDKCNESQSGQEKSHSGRSDSQSRGAWKTHLLDRLIDIKEAGEALGPLADPQDPAFQENAEQAI